MRHDLNAMARSKLFLSLYIPLRPVGDAGVTLEGVPMIIQSEGMLQRGHDAKQKGYLMRFKTHPCLPPSVTWIGFVQLAVKLLRYLARPIHLLVQSVHVNDIH